MWSTSESETPLPLMEPPADDLTTQPRRHAEDRHEQQQQDELPALSTTIDDVLELMRSTQEHDVSFGSSAMSIGSGSGSIRSRNTSSSYCTYEQSSMKALSSEIGAVAAEEHAHHHHDVSLFTAAWTSVVVNDDDEEAFAEEEKQEQIVDDHVDDSNDDTDAGLIVVQEDVALLQSRETETAPHQQLQLQPCTPSKPTRGNTTTTTTATTMTRTSDASSLLQEKEQQLPELGTSRSTVDSSPATTTASTATTATTPSPPREHVLLKEDEKGDDDRSAASAACAAASRSFDSSSPSHLVVSVRKLNHEYNEENDDNGSASGQEPNEEEQNVAVGGLPSSSSYVHSSPRTRPHDDQSSMDKDKDGDSVESFAMSPPSLRADENLSRTLFPLADDDDDDKDESNDDDDDESRRHPFASPATESPPREHVLLKEDEQGDDDDDDARSLDKSSPRYLVVSVRKRKLNDEFIRKSDGNGMASAFSLANDDNDESRQLAFASPSSTTIAADPSASSSVDANHTQGTTTSDVLVVDSENETAPSSLTNAAKENNDEMDHDKAAQENDDARPPATAAAAVVSTAAVTTAVASANQERRDVNHDKKKRSLLRGWFPKRRRKRDEKRTSRRRLGDGNTNNGYDGVNNDEEKEPVVVLAKDDVHRFGAAAAFEQVEQGTVVDTAGVAAAVAVHEDKDEELVKTSPVVLVDIGKTETKSPSSLESDNFDTEKPVVLAKDDVDRDSAAALQQMDKGTIVDTAGAAAATAVLIDKDEKVVTIPTVALVEMRKTKTESSSPKESHNLNGDVVQQEHAVVVVSTDDEEQQNVPIEDNAETDEGLLVAATNNDVDMDVFTDTASSRDGHAFTAAAAAAATCADSNPHSAVALMDTEISSTTTMPPTTLDPMDDTTSLQGVVDSTGNDNQRVTDTLPANMDRDQEAEKRRKNNQSIAILVQDEPDARDSSNVTDDGASAADNDIASYVASNGDETSFNILASSTVVTPVVVDMAKTETQAATLQLQPIVSDESNVSERSGTDDDSADDGSVGFKNAAVIENDDDSGKGSELSVVQPRASANRDISGVAAAAVSDVLGDDGSRQQETNVLADDGSVTKQDNPVVAVATNAATIKDDLVGGKTNDNPHNVDDANTDSGLETNKDMSLNGGYIETATANKEPISEDTSVETRSDVDVLDDLSVADDSNEGADPTLERVPAKLDIVANVAADKKIAGEMDPQRANELASNVDLVNDALTANGSATTTETIHRANVKMDIVGSIADDGTIVNINDVTKEAVERDETDSRSVGGDTDSFKTAQASNTRSVATSLSSDCGDRASTPISKESREDQVVTSALGAAGAWRAFDLGNVLKADRTPSNDVVAAAAVPLPSDGPEETFTDEKSLLKTSPPNGEGSTQDGLVVTGAVAFGASMGGDDNKHPGEDVKGLDFDEEAQSLVESTAPSQVGRCNLNRRQKLICIVFVHFLVVGVVLGVVLPMILKKSSDPVVGLGTTPSPSQDPNPTPPVAPMPTVPAPPEATIAPVSPTLEPTKTPTQLPLGELLSSVSFDGGVAMSTPLTAQSEAFNWLSNNTFLDTYSDEKRIQRYSLATFYFSSDGDNWDNNEGWLSDEDECSWFNTAFGGFCSNSSGAVVEFDMMNNGVGGILPEEIGLLPLKELNIADNDLVGSLPTTIGRLTSLVDLMIWSNGITGPLPSELGLMTRLETLDLPLNDISGSIPSTVAQMTNLDWLSLSNNELTGTVPAVINNMVRLNNLYLYNNALEGTFSCSDSILQCWISCNDDDDECRTLDATSD